MSHQQALSNWTEEVGKRFSHLSKPQVTVLALFSFAMVMVQSCGNSSNACFLALLLEEKEATLRQKLREFCYAAGDKRGQQRRDLDVMTCFAPLLSWVLAYWSSDEQRIALALDATTLRQVFTVLSLSVVYRGCAIPVAWIILPAGEQGTWRPHWEHLLQAVADVIPPDWVVIVLTDRGLYAKWLFETIQKNHWHPFMRINAGGQYRPQGQAHFQALAQVVNQPGQQWCGLVACFKTTTARLHCTLLACWETGCSEAWLILTDLPPEASCAAWYGMRTWIEQGFKDIKRGGLRWEQTKMTDPQRAERLWLVIAVATLWAVLVGGAADARLAASSLSPLPSRTTRTLTRRLSCFKRGVITLLVALIKGDPLPTGCFVPEAWLAAQQLREELYVPT